MRSQIEKWVLVILIPLFAGIILIFTDDKYTKEGQSLLLQFFITCFITATIWLSVVVVFEKVTKAYPDFKHTYKRLLILIPATIIITLIVYSIDHIVICSLIYGRIIFDSFFEEIKITYVATTIVYVSYECAFFYKNWKKTVLYSEQLQKENAIARYESLKNQINPHFLFNSLNTLTAIIHQDADKAVDFVQKLSNSYRYLLTMREKELVDLPTELSFVNAYIFLIKSRYGENIRIDLHIPKDCHNLLLPPVSLQMLIENCIKHNVISKDKPLIIHVFIEQDFIVVDNNLQAKQVYESSTQLGLENIRRRYSLLTEKSVEVIKTDTKFVVKLPLLRLSI